MFGKVKSQKGYSLRELVVANGARVSIKGDGHESYKKKVFFGGGKLSLSLEEDELRSAVAFANELNHAVTGTDADLYRIKKTSLVQDGVNALEQSLGASPDLLEEVRVPVPAPEPPVSGGSADGDFSPRRKEEPDRPRKASARCRFCGAPIKATAGRTVRCPYCDGEQEWNP